MNCKKILHCAIILGATTFSTASSSKAQTPPAQPLPIDLSKAPVADANTILLLHFDEAEGTKVGDAAPSAHKADVSGAQQAEGKFGKALHFDGEDDFVDMGGAKGVPADFDFDATTDFTIDLWMKTSSKRDQMYLVSKKMSTKATEPGYHLYLSGTNLVAVIADGTNRVVLNHRPSLRDGQWHHIALVAERKGNATLYVDGKASASAPMQEVGKMTNRLRALRIGDRNHDDDFEGELDEVRLSNVARTFAANE